LRNLIGLENVVKALEETFRGRVLELNKKLLYKSFEDGVKIAEEKRSTR